MSENESWWVGKTGPAFTEAQRARQPHMDGDKTVYTSSSDAPYRGQPREFAPKPARVDPRPIIGSDGF